MKNTLKISIILTLLTFGSLGCSSNSTEKALLDVSSEELAYDPNNTVEISGIIEHGVMPGMHHFQAKHHSDISMDTMIMVSQLQLITAQE